jgi:hypothetical protein
MSRIDGILTTILLLVGNSNEIIQLNKRFDSPIKRGLSHQNYCRKYMDSLDTECDATLGLTRLTGLIVMLIVNIKTGLLRVKRMYSIASIEAWDFLNCFQFSRGGGGGNVRKYGHVMI